MTEANDNAEVMIEHMSLEAVLSLIVALEDVRLISAEPVAIQTIAGPLAPTMPCARKAAA